MKINKLSLLLICFSLLLVFETQAQTFYKTDTTNAFNRNSSLLNNKKFGFSVDFGFGFAAGSNNNSGTYTYVAPYLSYLVTPKFKLDVGGVISKGFSSFYYDQPNTLSSNNTNYFLFARGSYLLTDRITLSGTVYKSFSPYSTISAETTNKKAFDNAGLSLGMNYKISDHMTIGAQVSVSNGNSGNYFIQPQTGYFGGFTPGRGGNGFMGW
jgi:hypothetical protein